MTSEGSIWNNVPGRKELRCNTRTRVVNSRSQENVVISDAGGVGRATTVLEEVEEENGS